MHLAVDDTVPPDYSPRLQAKNPSMAADAVMGVHHRARIAPSLFELARTGRATRWLKPSCATPSLGFQRRDGRGSRHDTRELAIEICQRHRMDIGGGVRV